ncbi:MAG: indoleamine 2,3-dioxygenase, partial [Pseudomonadota bacterium]
LIERLPLIDPRDWVDAADEPVLRMAMLRYSFLTQAYVWGEPEAPHALPAQLAVPIWHLAQALGQQPLLPYSSYALDNWAKIDADGDFGFDNIHVLQSFLGGQDEAWFILIHVAIEATAGGILDRIPALLRVTQEGDLVRVASLLLEMVEVYEEINAIFERMGERCDPYVYFHRVRPFIHGWRDNPALGKGLIYDGVAQTRGLPQTFRGQTGSQSSIVPTMDALLGVGHAADPLRNYLDELHFYRPVEHRAFIDAVRERSGVRHFVASAPGAQGQAARDAYNALIEQVAAFRSQHLRYAASYINKQSHGGRGNDSEVGTGGTPFMKYLRKHRTETAAMLLP